MKFNKKEFKASLLKNSGLLNLLRSADLKKTDTVPILAYHGIFNDKEKYNPASDLISATAEAFDEQLRYIKDLGYRVTTFKYLKDLRFSRAKTEDKLLIITFDDGFKNNYDIAFPIIKRYGLTATIFVATDYIDNGSIFWFEKLNILLRETSASEINISYPIKMKYDIRTPDSKNKCSSEIKKMLKGLPDIERQQLLYSLMEELDWNSCCKGLPRMVLSWDEIKGMSDYGIEIGSHTINHPILTKVSNQILKYELTMSKKRIEEMTGKEVISLAYPNGSYDERVKQEAMDAGYTFGLSYKHGLHKMIDDPFEIRRVIVENYFSMSLFKMHLINS